MTFRPYKQRVHGWGHFKLHAQEVRPIATAARAAGSAGADEVHGSGNGDGKVEVIVLPEPPTMVPATIEERETSPGVEPGEQSAEKPQVNSSEPATKRQTTHQDMVHQPQRVQGVSRLLR